MAQTAVRILVCLLPSVLGTLFLYDVFDTSRESFTIGDDVTLTCPVTLCDGEKYRSVEWKYWSCGRYYFKFCYTSFPSTLPTNQTEKPTLNIKNISCNQEGYYQCKVVGTKGTNREHMIDVYLFGNASATPRLTPNNISIHENDTGKMQITCVDNAHVPGSSIRMYWGSWGWHATFFDVPTKCTVDYQPNSCREYAICSGTFDKAILVNHETLMNSVHCDIIRPGGKKVETSIRVHVQRGQN